MGPVNTCAWLMGPGASPTRWMGPKEVLARLRWDPKTLVSYTQDEKVKGAVNWRRGLSWGGRISRGGTWTVKARRWDPLVGPLPPPYNYLPNYQAGVLVQLLGLCTFYAFTLDTWRILAYKRNDTYPLDMAQ